MNTIKNRAYIIIIGALIFAACRMHYSDVEIDEYKFMKMVQSGDVRSYTILEDRHEVAVWLWPDSSYKYKELEVDKESAETKSRFILKVVNGSDFQREMENYYGANPLVKRVPYKMSKMTRTER